MLGDRMTTEVRRKVDVLLERLSRLENLYLDRMDFDYEDFNLLVLEKLGRRCVVMGHI